MKRSLWLIALLCSCANDNLLQGSASEVFALDVSSVKVYRNDEAIQVSYFRNRGIYLDVVARLTVALKLADGGVDGNGQSVNADGGTNIDLKPGTRINLAEEYAPGHPRGVVVHAPGGEPARLCPPPKRGDFYLGSGGTPGDLTTGDFSVVFADEGGDIAFGRTLTGRFSGVAIDAGFGPLP